MSSQSTQRATQREQTRRQLIEAGLRVVAESGFAGATTAAIALATGKAHGTVFVHFATREVLVAELVAEVGRVISAKLADLDRQTPTISEVLTAHLAALEDNEILYARLLSEASTMPLAARAYIFALQSGVAVRLRAAYAHAYAAGYVREIDPIVLANIWISLTNHYLLNRDLFAPGESVAAKCGAKLQADLLQLIEAQPQ